MKIFASLTDRRAWAVKAAARAIQLQGEPVDACVWLHRQLLVHTLLLQRLEGVVHHAELGPQRCADPHVFRDALLLLLLPHAVQHGLAQGASYVTRARARVSPC